MPPFVHLDIVWDGSFAIRLCRDDGEGAAVVQGGPQGVVVEGLVSDQSVEIKARDERFNTNTVVTLAGEQDKARQIAQGVNQRNDLGC